MDDRTGQTIHWNQVTFGGPFTPCGVERRRNKRSEPITTRERHEVTCSRCQEFLK